MQQHTMAIPQPVGKTLIEGKTKVVTQHASDVKKVVLTAKDDITAHNKAMHDVISGKSQLATATTSNVFRFLKACGLPVAFDEQISSTQFVAPKCEMILYEVVVRREARGSFLKRYPYLKKGHVFPELILEFFLKTTDLQWNGNPIPADDPYVSFVEQKALLYRPDVPLWQQEPFMELEQFPLRENTALLDEMGLLAKQAFFAIEKAWQNAGSTLADFKLEFGVDPDGNLLIADVIDNDSWRVLHKGAYMDKQFYRDGGDLNTVSAKYQYVQEKTAQFSVPKQQLIIWRGSVRDDVADVQAMLDAYGDSLKTTLITCSMHKDPVQGYQELVAAIQSIPDSVVIAFVGRSNGAGPTLSANCSVPVITVPVGWEKFPDDIWSSLRAPSNVPVMTVLDRKNACLAALQIFAQHNPALNMQLQTERVGRARNVITL